MEAITNTVTDSSKRLSNLLDHLKLSANQFAVKIGLKGNSSIYHILNGRNEISEAFAYKVSKVYPDVDTNWLLTGKGQMISLDKEQPQQKPEVKQVSFDDFMEVEYLPAKAQAGYLSSLEDNQHLELETILVPSEFEKGNYTVIEIGGNSMDDNSNRSICDGDKLLVKELQDNYTNKLIPFRQFLFVIVSREGVVCKQITNHDVEKGLITCHSFNPTYSDYTIDLRDVYKLFYVKKIVERRIKF